ncbi:type II secretion system protein GspM [Xanthomonas sp. 60]
MQPSVRDRTLALALLLAVVALVYLLLVHPWFTAPLQVINQDIAGLHERGQRVDAQLAQQPQVEAALREVRAGLAGRPGFLTDATAEAAAASLGNRLQEVVTAASPEHRACTISNRTPLPDNRAAGDYPRVAMQVRLRCGVEEMATVLHGLETGTPRLFVENLNLLAQRYQQSPDETGTGLDVSFELVGYLLPDAAAIAGTPEVAAPVDASADAMPAAAPVEAVETLPAEPAQDAPEVRDGP